MTRPSSSRTLPRRPDSNRFTIARGASTRRRSSTRLAPAWRCSTSTSDGWLDVYLVNGSTVAALKGREPPPHAAALPQQPRRHFLRCHCDGRRGERQLGLGRRGRRLRQRRLARPVRGELRQEPPLPQQSTTARSATSQTAAGVDLGGWSTGPSWGDYDRDGRLDLFVPGYVTMTSTIRRKPGRPACYRHRASSTAYPCSAVLVA